MGWHVVWVWTRWYRRRSVEKSRSWESAVFEGRRIRGPVNFGAVKVSKKKAVRAMCDGLCMGTSESGAIGEWCIGTTLCEK